MITADRYQIMSRNDGSFFQLGPRHFYWKSDHCDGGIWPREDIERWLEMPGCPVKADEVEIVPAARCGCCGASIYQGLKLVKDSSHPVSRIWRCDKHIGRNPCMIEGCGRTFAVGAGESYRTMYLCGQHWRQAPKRMRDAVARVRRQGNRFGWGESLINRHSRLWMRCYRAIREGQQLDEAEIKAMFGWE